MEQISNEATIHNTKSDSFPFNKAFIKHGFLRLTISTQRACCRNRLRNAFRVGFDTKNTNKPAFYPVKRDFDEGNEKGPHYSFPNSRNAYKKVYVPFNTQTEPNNPGPGQYEIKNSFGDAPLYTMGIKCGGESFDNCSPGPASYNNNLSINGNGYYPLSTTENTKPINFSLYKGKRFNYRCKFYFFIFF